MTLQDKLESANLDIDLSSIKESYMEGPNEKDLLFGLIEETIKIALGKGMKICNEKGYDLRTGLYHNAIKRINQIYEIKSDGSGLN